MATHHPLLWSGQLATHALRVELDEIGVVHDEPLEAARAVDPSVGSCLMQASLGEVTILLFPQLIEVVLVHHPTGERGHGHMGRVSMDQCWGSRMRRGISPRGQTGQGGGWPGGWTNTAYLEWWSVWRFVAARQTVENKHHTPPMEKRLAVRCNGWRSFAPPRTLWRTMASRVRSSAPRFKA